MTRAARHRALPGRGTPLARQPFSVSDELSCYFDTPAEPANVHLEIAVPGRLDAEIFRASAVAALAANPRTSIRRAAGHRLRRRPAWVRVPQLDRDPVHFTSWSDTTDLDKQREALIARAPSLDQSPPVSLLVASGPGCDHVILNANHAAMDGQSALELLRDIARRYRARAMAADADRAVPTRTDPAVLPDQAEVAAQPAKLGPQARVGKATRQGTSAGTGARLPYHRPARIAAERGGRRGCGLLVHALPALPPVPHLGSQEKLTLNDVLVAALMLTIDRWNGEHGRPHRRIQVTVPLNARAQGQQRLAGNHSRLVTITADPPAMADELGLLRHVAQQVRHARLNPGPALDAGSRAVAALYCPAVVKRWLVRAFLRTAGPLVCDTVMLTNLGNVTDPPDFGSRNVTATTLSSSAHMPRGLSVGVATVGSRLQLGVRYNRKLLDETAATAFVAAYQATLDKITATWPHDRNEGGIGGPGPVTAQDPGLSGG